MKNILTVRGLHASIEGKEILRGIDFTVNAGEVHAIMGPNGSGKSTFASVIAGSPRFEVTAGTAEYDGKNLLEMNIEERARAGIFLGFQYPVEIPGVSMANFMKLAVARRREYLGLPPLSSGEFLKLMREKGKVVELDSKLTGRAVNEGFSSGLDIDALRIVAQGVNKLRTPQNATVVITHYQRLLDYIVPDFVHVLYKGQIILSGDRELALKLEREGYDWLINRYK